MGIRGLRQWLQFQSPPTPPKWETFKGTKIGVDILPFLYNAKKQNKCIVTTIAIMVQFLRSKQIEPIMFFDGKPPSEKKEVVKERSDDRSSVRKEMDILTKDLTNGPDDAIVKHEIQRLQATNPTVSYAERDTIKKFLYTMGVRFVNAHGESDPLLAYWSKTGVLSAILSPDMDMIARGVEHLIMVNEDEKWVDYTGSTILSDISLTLPQFQNMCVLMGTDYTNRVRTIPVRTAYNAIQSTATLEEAWTGLRQKVTDLPALQRAVRMLDGADATLDTLLNEREQAKWLAPAPTIEPAEFKVFKETYFPLIDITEETIALHIEGGTSTEETIAPPI
jgi:flap endonuclease-1